MVCSEDEAKAEKEIGKKFVLEKKIQFEQYYGSKNLGIRIILDKLVS